MTIKAFNLSLSLETRKRVGNSVQISRITQHERIHSEDNSIGRAKLCSLCNGWIMAQKGIYELSDKNLELVFLEAKVENEITGEIIAHILSIVTPKEASEPLPPIGPMSSHFVKGSNIYREHKKIQTLIRESQRAIANECKAFIAGPAADLGLLSDSEFHELRKIENLDTYLTFCALMLAIFNEES